MKQLFMPNLRVGVDGEGSNGVGGGWLHTGVQFPGPRFLHL